MFHTIRIKNKGVYLGRQCPTEGIVVSDFIITILRSMGADVEIYDPVEEAKQKEAKLKEKKAKEQEEIKELLTKPSDERVQQLEIENQAKQAIIENLQEEIKEIQEEKKDKVYTDDELSLLTVVELKSILINKGHTNPYTDPLAPRSKEKRDSLIAKIKSIQ